MSLIFDALIIYLSHWRENGYVYILWLTDWLNVERWFVHNKQSKFKSINLPMKDDELENTYTPVSVSLSLCVVNFYAYAMDKI